MALPCKIENGRIIARVPAGGEEFLNLPDQARAAAEGLNLVDEDYPPGTATVSASAGDAQWSARMSACRARFVADARLRKIYGIDAGALPGEPAFEAACGTFCATAAKMGFIGIDLPGQREDDAEARIRARFASDRSFRRLFRCISDDPRDAQYQKALAKAVAGERRDARGGA